MEESYEKSLRSLGVRLAAASAAHLERDLPQRAPGGGVFEPGDADNPSPPGAVLDRSADRLGLGHLAVELVDPDDPGPAEGRHCSTLVAPAPGDDPEALKGDRDS